MNRWRRRCMIAQRVEVRAGVPASPIAEFDAPWPGELELQLRPRARPVFDIADVTSGGQLVGADGGEDMLGTPAESELALAA